MNGISTCIMLFVTAVALLLSGLVFYRLVTQVSNPELFIASGEARHVGETNMYLLLPIITSVLLGFLTAGCLSAYYKGKPINYTSMEEKKHV